MPDAVAIIDNFNDPSEIAWTTVLGLPALVALVPFVLLLPAVHGFAHSLIPNLVIIMCFIPWLRHVLTTGRFLLFHSETALSGLCSWLAIAGLALNAYIQIASGVVFDLASTMLGPIFTEKDSVPVMVLLALGVSGACYGSWYLAHTIRQQRSLSMKSEIATSTILFLASILPGASVFALVLVAIFDPGLRHLSTTVGPRSMVYAYYFGLALAYALTFGGLKLISTDQRGSAHSGTQQRSIRQSTR